MKSLIKESQNIAEIKHGKRVMQLAEKYFKKYRTQMKDLEEHSLLKQVRDINAWDYYSLGAQLEAWDVYRHAIKEEEGD